MYSEKKIKEPTFLRVGFMTFWTLFSIELSHKHYIFNFFDSFAVGYDDCEYDLQLI